MEQFKRLKPPSFKGIADPIEAEAWTIHMVKICKVLDCIEECEVLFAIYMLEGEALYWWRIVERSLHELEVDPTTWGDFMKGFNANCFPVPVRHHQEAEFLELVQARRLITD